MSRKIKLKLKSLKFDKKGLVPAIIQDYKTGEVLMLAYMNKESLKLTLKLGKTCYWSRSRKKYWVKGETSGNYQYVKSIAYDCDVDSLLIKVRQVGAACHTGNRSCFYRKLV
jgi:phosphoribosyl-AMP cyclohydrolase